MLFKSIYILEYQLNTAAFECQGFHVPSYDIQMKRRSHHLEWIDLDCLALALFLAGFSISLL
jgi:hypothetical protein